MTGSESKGLVSAASRGDAGAVEELLERHLPGLRAFIARNATPLIARKESFSDLAQSACREVLEELPRYRYEGEDHFRNWLYLSATRKIYERTRYLRAQKRDAERDQSGDYEPGGAEPSPSQDVAAFEQVEKVERVLTGFSDEQRRILMLSRIVGLSHAEIADELEMTEAAVRKSYSRALAKFMLAWEQE